MYTHYNDLWTIVQFLYYSNSFLASRVSGTKAILTSHKPWPRNNAKNINLKKSFLFDPLTDIISFSECPNVLFMGTLPHPSPHRSKEKLWTYINIHVCSAGYVKRERVCLFLSQSCHEDTVLFDAIIVELTVTISAIIARKTQTN